CSFYLDTQEGFSYTSPIKKKLLINNLDGNNLKTRETAFISDPRHTTSPILQVFLDNVQNQLPDKAILGVFEINENKEETVKSH
ncbi:MAG: hypothetical protein KAQ81_10545, partial [Deltaproteobacteria bacterium]|nr:hypothetical protein [Deltaproteobacteria bacterium]